MKYTPLNTNGGYNLSVINQNFQEIADALNSSVLYRNCPTGEPNQMFNDLDMNSHQILNLPAPATLDSPVRLRDVQNGVPAVGSALFTTFEPYLSLTSTNVQGAMQQAEDQILINASNITSLTNSLNTKPVVLGSIANLRAFNNNGVSQATVTSYYGDGSGRGGGLYVYAPGDTTTPDNGGTRITDSLGRRWYWQSQGEILNVQHFGAKGDGSTDDTTAIQAAITWTESLTKTDFWATYGPRLRIPAGVYNARGFLISKPIIIHGDGRETTALNLITGANASMFDVKDTGGAGGADGGNIIPCITDLTINGNSSGQTGGFSRGISLRDADVPLSTQYRGGANIERVTLRACEQFGIYIGANRNNGRLNDVKCLYSGQEALYSRGYDWRGHQLDMGNSVNSNVLTFFEGGAWEIYGSNIYFTKQAGINIGNGVNANMMFVNCFIDTNGTQGAYVDNFYGSTVAHSFIGCTFRDNSRLGDNAQPHIQLNNCPFTIVSNCTFIVNDTTTQPSYIIQQTGTHGRVLFTGNQFEIANSTLRPYRTALTNDFDNLHVSGTSSVALAHMGTATMGIIGAAPKWSIKDNVASAGNQRWTWNTGSGTLQLCPASDDNTAFGSPAIQVTRSGNTVGEVDINNNALRIFAASVNTVQIAPQLDNAFSCGTGSNRWSVVFSATGTINTSDKRLKNSIQEIDEGLIFAFRFIKPKQYKLNGDDKWHIGYIAQDLQEALVMYGYNPSDYAMWYQGDDDGYMGLRYDQIAVLKDASDRYESEE